MFLIDFFIKGFKYNHSKAVVKKVFVKVNTNNFIKLNTIN